MSAPTAPAEDPGFELLPWDSERFGFPVARVRSSVPPEILSAAVADEMRQRGVVLAYYGLADVSPEYPTRCGEHWRPTRRYSDRLSEGLGIAEAREGLHRPPRSGERTGENSACVRNQVCSRASGWTSVDRACARRGPVFALSGGPENRPPECFTRSTMRGSAARYGVKSPTKCSSGRSAGEAWVSSRVAGGAGRRSIGLLSIGDSARGRGFGRAMTEHAFGWAADRGCRVLRVTTQLANAAACALYASVGCSVESRERTYHIWLA